MSLSDCPQCGFEKFDHEMICQECRDDLYETDCFDYYTDPDRRALIDIQEGYEYWNEDSWD